jgi:uncharacterized protein (TIRG00374 family)
MPRTKSLLIYGLIAFFAIWCAIALRKDLAQMSLAPLATAWPLVLLAGVMSLLNYALRIVRWRSYLAHLGHALPLGFAGQTFTAGFAFTLSPGKVGEMVRARYTPNIPLSTIAAAFFMERLMDLMAMVVLALAAFAAAGSYHGLLYGSVFVAVALLVMLALMPWPRLAASFAAYAEAHPALPLAKSLNGVLRTVIAARALLTPTMLLQGFLLGLFAWGLEAWGLYVIGGMFPDVAISVGAAVGAYALATIVGALSFLPGGLGSTEAMMVLLLTAQGFSTAQALLLTLVCRLLTLWLAVLLGWLAVWRLRGHLSVEEVSHA